MISPKIVARKVKAFSESLKVVTTTYIFRKDNEEFEFDFYSMNLPDFVVGLVIKDDKILLVDQYRFPVKGMNTEFVCGRIEPGSNSSEAIEREMHEEAGILVKNKYYLGSLKPMAGRSKNRCFVYLIEEFNEAKPNREKFEELTELKHYWMPLDEFKDKVLNNIIDDGITIMAWGLYLTHKGS